MSFAANITAVIGSFSKKKTSKGLNRPSTKKWVRFENKLENLRVDFSEDDLIYVSSARVGTNKIKHEGIIFKYKESYLRSEDGSLVWLD